MINLAKKRIMVTVRVGFLEAVYEEAMAIESIIRNIPFIKSVKLGYKLLK